MRGRARRAGRRRARALCVPCAQQPPQALLCAACLPPLVCTRACTQATPAHLESVVASLLSAPGACGLGPLRQAGLGLLPSLLKPLLFKGQAPSGVLSMPAAG